MSEDRYLELAPLSALDALTARTARASRRIYPAAPPAARSWLRTG